MVSKYSLLFDVKFQSMFPIRQKKDSAIIAATLLTEDHNPLLKDKTLDNQSLTPIKD